MQKSPCEWQARRRFRRFLQATVNFAAFCRDSVITEGHPSLFSLVFCLTLCILVSHFEFKCGAKIIPGMSYKNRRVWPWFASYGPTSFCQGLSLAISLAYLPGVSKPCQNPWQKVKFLVVIIMTIRSGTGMHVGLGMKYVAYRSC
jgi:hypothetical protein